MACGLTYGTTVATALYVFSLSLLLLLGYCVRPREQRTHFTDALFISSQHIFSSVRPTSTDIFEMAPK